MVDWGQPRDLYVCNECRHVHREGYEPNACPECGSAVTHYRQPGWD